MYIQSSRSFLGERKCQYRNMGATIYVIGKNEYTYMISVIRHLRNKCILHKLVFMRFNSYHEIETERNKPILIDEINLFILFCYTLLSIQYRLIKIKNNKRNQKNNSDP